MAETILEMSRITKRFPGVLALDDVSLSAKKGEVLAIVGENGAGKSTLMKILSGSYPSSSFSGTIRIDGTEVSFNEPADAEDAGIAMIYQEINTHLDLSITENLFMGHWQHTSYGRVQWPVMHREAEKILSAVDLCIEPRTIMRKLNTSQQQLVCIAKAISISPRILVLDEPTSALTEREAEILFATIGRLKQEGIASLLISHKLDEVFANSDAIIVLRDGKSVGRHEREGFDRGEIVREMVGRKLSEFFPERTASVGEVSLEVDSFTVPHPDNPVKNIVSDVSFSVRKGEIFGIAGLVGSGRSELISAVFGKIPRRSGRVFLDGREVDTGTPAKAIKAGLALVTEDRKTDGFVDLMNIRQNITLANLKKVSRAGHIFGNLELNEAGRLSDRLRIKAPDLRTRLLTLSGGNQQKVVLSKWLMTTPKLLFLDEPTRGIDVGTKSEIYTIMQELASEGISIIMISSELPELISMSDRVLVLSGGRVSGLLEKEQLSQEAVMDYATRFTEEAEKYALCESEEKI
jgi:D-xylose transport system ATP-binding protein